MANLTEDSAAMDRASMHDLVLGRERALDELMSRHAAPIHQFLLRMVHQEETAADLAQETFVRVFTHAAKYDPSQRFSTWLYTIASNLARDFLRGQKRRPTVSLNATTGEEELTLGDLQVDPSPLAPDVLMTEEQCARVRRAVAALPDDLREAVVLCELENLSLAEAAEILQSTVKAIESRLYRARKLLRKAMVRQLL